MIKPEVFSAIMDHFASGEPIIRAAVPSGEMGGEAEAHPHQISPDDSETVQMIKELLETRFDITVTHIRACVHGDVLLLRVAQASCLRSCRAYS